MNLAKAFTLPVAPVMPKLFQHQQETIAFLATTPCAFIMSEPGTGKTRAVLESINPKEGKTLILCPKSIMQASWGNDIQKFTPHLTYTIASAEKRQAKMAQDVNIYITNHDAVKSLDTYDFSQFQTLIIDESTAFKNPTSQRSKAIKKLSLQFSRRILMSGTPTPNTILDIWHQVYLLDQGYRLGNNYHRFRSNVCEPHQVGRMPNAIKWTDKPGAETAISDLISDITIKHKLEDVIDMPEHVVNEYEFTLSPKHFALYTKLKNEAVLELTQSELTAINAAALANKLLQMASGAAFISADNYHTFATERYELIIDLVKERKHSLVAFNWHHQKDELVKLATKEKLTFGVIDGKTSLDERTRIVNDMQAGKLQVVFAHPQTAGHGLTLTKATTTIWASPTYNAEHFEQFNRRIYRAGQTQRTETILIKAKDTLETNVYLKLQAKLDKQTNLLALL